MDGWVWFFAIVVAACGGAPAANEPSPCDGPQPVLQVDENGVEQPTGWVQCNRGLMHRAEQRDCIYPSSLSGSCSSVVRGGPCSADADCSAEPHGYCNEVSGFGDIGCVCNHGCERDDDCGADQACLCLGASSR